MPTPTLEEYLETIYKIAGDGVAKPSRIAEAMGVSGPTVTATLKRLGAQGFVTREGTDVRLTALGVERSVEIVRKHRIAERFLVDVLGLDWEAAHEEHVCSNTRCHRASWMHSSGIWATRRCARTVIPFLRPTNPSLVRRAALGRGLSWLVGAGVESGRGRVASGLPGVFGADARRARECG